MPAVLEVERRVLGAAEVTGRRRDRFAMFKVIVGVSKKCTNGADFVEERSPAWVSWVLFFWEALLGGEGVEEGRK